MRFGLAGLQAGRGCEPDGLAEVARMAESLGFESLWAAEHVIIPERVTSRYPFNAESKLRFGRASWLNCHDRYERAHEPGIQRAC